MLSAEQDLLDAEALRARFDFLTERDGFALAVSGGPDSLALLVMVAKWRDLVGYGGKIYVLSVDHQLRVESAEEVRAVGKIAARSDFLFEGLCWDGEKPETGLAAAARAARYQLMVTQMEVLGINTLLLGHHRDDQAETVLMRMAHGSGVAGLSGMARVSQQWGVELVRVLLDVGKADLIELVAAEGLVAALDPSNKNAGYERVRWRNMLDVLGENGLSTARLGVLAGRMARANEALDHATAVFLAAGVRLEISGKASILKSEFLALPRDIAQRVLIAVTHCLGGSFGVPGYARLELAQAENLYERIAVVGERDTLSIAGCLVWWDDLHLCIDREAGRNLAPPKSLSAGKSTFWDNRVDVTCASNAPGDFCVGPLGAISRATLAELSGGTITGTKYLGATPCVREGEKIVAIADFLSHKDIVFRFRCRDMFAG